ncbi:flagellar hook-basal body complex protein FliE [Anaerovorax odorimutans]|uniref:flagellar hook-basal body complex protein FliE n=1 Tax=Anaerovorax odorimutans TaxID=109327 RepID=UPI0003FFBE4D|nr:flagellar hook-basal body complex protein FliE [Anaerovorax odorimutans]
MFITDINKIDGIQNTKFNEKDYSSEGAQVPFKSVFEDAIKNVAETDEKVNSDVALLATGQSDDLHNLQIDITKAQLSLQMMVQLRNRAMDAYSEIMRINL